MRKQAQDTKLRSRADSLRAERAFLQREPASTGQLAELAGLRLRALFRQGATTRPIYASKGRAGSASYRPQSGPVYQLISK